MIFVQYLIKVIFRKTKTTFILGRREKTASEGRLYVPWDVAFLVKPVSMWILEAITVVNASPRPSSSPLQVQYEFNELLAAFVTPPARSIHVMAVTHAYRVCVCVCVAEIAGFSSRITEGSASVTHARSSYARRYKSGRSGHCTYTGLVQAWTFRSKPTKLISTSTVTVLVLTWGAKWRKTWAREAVGQPAHGKR